MSGKFEPSTRLPRLISMKTAIALLALALTATAAAAQSAPPVKQVTIKKAPHPLMIIPPVEFDHPYAGEIVWVYVNSQQEVRDYCPNAAFSVKLGALGCSAKSLIREACRIVLGPEADMKAVGLTMGIVIRHEIGHCNGWGPDHKGARAFIDWAN